MKTGEFLICEDGKYYLSSTPAAHTIAIVFDAEKKLACSVEVETSADWQTAFNMTNDQKRLMSVDEFNQILENKDLRERLSAVNNVSFWLNHRIGVRALATGWNSWDEHIIQCAPLKNQKGVLFVYCLSAYGL